MKFGLCLVAGAAMVAGSGCGLFRGRGAKTDPDEEVKKPVAQVVGEIASVHSDDRFVLIRRFAQVGFSPDMLYSSLSPGGSTASLRPTGEKLGRFYAADIQEGTPTAGDLVIGRWMPPEAVPEATPVPDQGPNSGPKPWMRENSGL